jgi:hypothetical protein
VIWLQIIAGIIGVAMLWDAVENMRLGCDWSSPAVLFASAIAFIGFTL